jgi:glycine cleavage system aminomethyltransferase T
MDLWAVFLNFKQSCLQLHEVHFVLQSKGTEVVDSLQYLCSNDVDIPVGGIIHTGMQNKKGGYENDCSLARIAENQ